MIINNNNIVILHINQTDFNFFKQKTSMSNILELRANWTIDKSNWSTT